MGLHTGHPTSTDGGDTQVGSMMRQEESSNVHGFTELDTEVLVTV